MIVPAIPGWVFLLYGLAVFVVLPVWAITTVTIIADAVRRRPVSRRKLGVFLFPFVVCFAGFTIYAGVQTWRDGPARAATAELEAVLEFLEIDHPPDGVFATRGRPPDDGCGYASSSQRNAPTQEIQAAELAAAIVHRLRSLDAAVDVSVESYDPDDAYNRPGRSLTITADRADARSITVIIDPGYQSGSLLPDGFEYSLARERDSLVSVSVEGCP